MLRAFAFNIVPAGMVSAGISLTLNHFTGLCLMYWPWTVLYFAAFVSVLYPLSMQRVKDKDFTAFLLFALSLKMILAFCIILLCAFLVRAWFGAFSAHFLAHFVVFTVFELVFLLKLIRAQARSGEAGRPDQSGIRARGVSDRSANSDR
ncbi:MAG TPA: hypothetical protein PLQ93_06675 [Bacteroidia bacterium]|nr:hypothetical protein [Bacteroidia bacterium]